MEIWFEVFFLLSSEIDSEIMICISVGDVGMYFNKFIVGNFCWLSWILFDSQLMKEILSDPTGPLNIQPGSPNEFQSLVQIVWHLKWQQRAFLFKGWKSFFN